MACTTSQAVTFQTATLAIPQGSEDRSLASVEIDFLDRPDLCTNPLSLSPALVS